MPAIPPLARPLADDRVLLRLAAERDIPETLIAYQDDPEMHERFGEPRPPSGAELGRAAERLEPEMAAGAGVALTILEPGSNECRGQLNVHRIDWDSGRAELGIWLAPQVRGHGLAPRALKLAAAWLFETCGLERLALIPDTENAPMLAAAAAAGFVREGVFRGYTRARGRRLDAIVLSLLSSDPRAAG